LDPALGSDERKNETLESITRGKFLYQICYCQLLKEDNAPYYYSAQGKFLHLFTEIPLDYNAIV
jgi:hypothetical protein